MTTAVEQHTWLFAREIAEHFRVSYWDVLRALESGQLVGVQRKRAGKWRVHRDEVAKWVERGCPVPADRRRR